MRHLRAVVALARFGSFDSARRVVEIDGVFEDSSFVESALPLGANIALRRTK
jgi:hypothetical protein